MARDDDDKVPTSSIVMRAIDATTFSESTAQIVSYVIVRGVVERLRKRES